jgi:hypothetical protein
MLYAPYPSVCLFRTNHYLHCLIPTPCHLPINLNCLFIHLIDSLRSSRSNSTTPHSFLLVLVPSAIVPSIPLLAYPSTPPYLFTYSYIPIYSTCLSLSFNTTCCCSLYDLNLLVPLPLIILSLRIQSSLLLPLLFVFMYTVMLYMSHSICQYHLLLPSVSLPNCAFPHCAHYQQTFIHNSTTTITPSITILCISLYSVCSVLFANTTGMFVSSPLLKSLFYLYYTSAVISIHSVIRQVCATCQGYIHYY